MKFKTPSSEVSVTQVLSAQSRHPNIIKTVERHQRHWLWLLTPGTQKSLRKHFSTKECATNYGAGQVVSSSNVPLASEPVTRVVATWRSSPAPEAHSAENALARHAMDPTETILENQ